MVLLILDQCSANDNDNDGEEDNDNNDNEDNDNDNDGEDSGAFMYTKLVLLTSCQTPAYHWLFAASQDALQVC